MKRVVVGGHTRNIGKTQTACAILAETADLGWTAVKMTRFGHGMCATDGKPCDCAVNDPVHPYVVAEERDRDGGEDTCRMLRAGAKRAWWLRAPLAQLGLAMPALEERIAGESHVLFESNSGLDFFTPDLYVAVLDTRIEDFKDSARRHLERADAFVLAAPEVEPPWPWFDRELLQRKAVFGLGDSGLSAWVRRGLGGDS
ncbi:MAG: hypothetical protein H6509_04270 [Bryobacterales bacterium]|nr:hypothetical protein [Acidobacteriota bacterium]MCB9383808.1 hypothetical protein [Bryobacterales bacterium]